MKNYKASSEIGQDNILTYFLKRMREKQIKKGDLAEILEINRVTLYNYFKKETPMPLSVYLEICGALDLRPYLIPSELDKNEINVMDFN